MLTPGKGVPPQLPPQRESALLRAAGSPENSLARSEHQGGVEMSGRRASRHIDAKRACRPGVEQRAVQGSEKGSGRSNPPSCPD